MVKHFGMVIVKNALPTVPKAILSDFGIFFFDRRRFFNFKSLGSIATETLSKKYGMVVVVVVGARGWGYIYQSSTFY